MNTTTGIVIGASAVPFILGLSSNAIPAVKYVNGLILFGLLGFAGLGILAPLISPPQQGSLDSLGSAVGIVIGVTALAGAGVDYALYKTGQAITG